MLQYFVTSCLQYCLIIVENMHLLLDILYGQVFHLFGEHVNAFSSTSSKCCPLHALKSLGTIFQPTCPCFCKYGNCVLYKSTSRLLLNPNSQATIYLL